MSDLVAYAVLYPAAMRFLPEFWGSLSPQLGTEHVAYLSLDGVTPDEVTAVIGKQPALRFLQPEAGASPAAIRSEDLLALTRQHAAVVLLDADDVLLPNRMGAAAAGLEEADVYACALQLVDESGARIDDLSFRPTEAQLEALTSDSALLARVNAFGFSNTAYRSAVLQTCLPVPDDTVLMDWLVASRAHLAGATLVFDAGGHMLYRQYGSNTASVLPPFGAERIQRDAARVAAHHRKLLRGLDAGIPSKVIRSVEPFEDAARLSHAFNEWLTATPTNAQRYASILADDPRGVWLWWEHVAAEPSGTAFVPPHHGR